MVIHLQTEDGAQFEALWNQYGDLVYNLSVRLTGSPKQGWLLARTSFLDARRKIASLEGRTPTYWLYEMVVNAWYLPYVEQSNFLRRTFCKQTSSRWEALLPPSVEAGLTFVSDQQETLLKWLKTLEYPQRLVAVLRLADDVPIDEIARITPLSESKIKKYTKASVKHLSKSLQTAGVAVPGDYDGRVKKISSVLRQWQTMKAPLTLKADIIQRRVTQKLMSHQHIENELSLKGLILILVLVFSSLVVFLGYCWVIGHKHIPYLGPE